MSINSLLKLNKPVIMGILNVTPDSFSDGGLFCNQSDAVNHALQMEKDGADIIDIGGESTRPGSKPVTVAEEQERVLGVLREIRKHSDIPISIDTTKSSVARSALEEGADMINDISAGNFDDKILGVVAEFKAPLCLMHMRGTPQNMQENTNYDNLISEIRDYLRVAIEKALSHGVKQILIDPGIGFGKSADANIEILRRLNEIQIENYPILIGTSRKSFIGKKLGLEVNERLEPTLATLYLSYQNGASWFRVHDVKPVKRFLDMVLCLGSNA